MAVDPATDDQARSTAQVCDVIGSDDQSRLRGLVGRDSGIGGAEIAPVRVEHDARSPEMLVG